MKQEGKATIFCSSAVIERDWLKQNGLTEIPDGIFVSREDCQRCRINCPQKPDYQPNLPSKLPKRYQTLSW